MVPYALRPSSAWRWVNCSGYLKMAAAHPERPGKDNTVREEGQAFHSVAYRTAMGMQRYADGDVVDTGVAKVDVDDFMLECVTEYIDEMKSWGVPCYLETPMVAPDIHPQCGGTPDVWGVCHRRRKIWLMDGKYGYRPVDPFESMQLGCYLSAIMTQLGVPKDGYHEQYWEVEFIIYQPRCPGESFKRWSFNLAEYGRGLFNRLRVGAYAAMGEQTSLRAGDHCLDCEAAADCPALRKATLQCLDVVDVTHSDTLSESALAYELQLLERFEKLIGIRREALELEGTHRVREGAILPGYNLEPSTTRQRWNDNVDQGFLIDMAATMGLGDIAKPRKAITPKQAEAVLGVEMVKQFSNRPPGKLKLKRQSGDKIRKAFSR